MRDLMNVLKFYFSQKLSPITIHDSNPVIAAGVMGLKHEVSEENLNHVPRLHLDGVDLVLVIKVVPLFPVWRRHQIIACLITVHFFQESDVRGSEFGHVTAEAARGRVLGRHSGPRGSSLLKEVVSVVHDAAAVIRGPVGLTFRPLTLAVLVPGASAVLDIVLVHSYVVVTI